MVNCNMDGQRCLSPRFIRGFYRGPTGFVDCSTQCLSCGAGWVEPVTEPEDGR